MMKPKYNTKFELLMEIIAMLYLFVTLLLANLNLIDSKNFLTPPFIVWTLMWIVIGINKKKLVGLIDEFVIHALAKANKISMSFLMYSILLFSAILISPFAKSLVLSRFQIGICLLFILFAFTIIRFFSFIYYDRKGI